MQFLKPRLKILLQEAVDEIRAKGVEPSVDEILWLHDLVKKSINPTRSDTPCMIDLPIVVGNVRLYPLGFGAKIWLEEYAKVWFDSDRQYDLLSFAFALANAKRPDVFELMITERAARRMIKAWSRGLTCSPAELNHAVEKITGVNDFDVVDVPVPGKTPDEDDHAVTGDRYGDVIAMLCHAYHLPPKVFLWEYSTDVCYEMLRKIPAMDGCDPETLKNRKFDAFADLRLAVEHIIAKGAARGV